MNKTWCKPAVLNILTDNNYVNTKVDGNKLYVFIGIPASSKKTAYRQDELKKIHDILLASLPYLEPSITDNPALSSIGGIIFEKSPIKIIVKDAARQGKKRNGVKNEHTLVHTIQDYIDQHGWVNVVFKDARGKQLKLSKVNSVTSTGHKTDNHKKADITLSNGKNQLPISIKMTNASIWESADGYFGHQAREILDSLVSSNEVNILQISEKINKNGVTPVFAIDKEIVIEPIEGEIMTSVFGTDLHIGGVVIQTFDESHFKLKRKTLYIECDIVITEINDIPESHSMVWLIRNDIDRNSKAVGIAGIRPMGVTAERGFGKSKNKNIIYVPLSAR